MKHALMLGLLAASLVAAGTTSAATINVPADQPTIQAAVNAAAASGDEIVVAAGTYVGTIRVEDKSLTIRGASAVTRPVVVVNGELDPGAPTVNGGILIYGDAQTVVLENLVVVPNFAASAGASAKGLLSGTKTAAATQNITVRNVLFAPNDGSNAPLITDPFDTTTAIPSGTGTSNDWPTDVLYMMNRNLVGFPTSVGTITLQDVVVIGAGRDGIIIYPGSVGSSLNISGTYVSRSDRAATQIGDDNLNSATVTITGNRANPGLAVIANHRNTLPAALSSGINGAGVVTISGLVVLANTATNATSGYQLNADNFTSLSITDSLVAGNTNIGLVIPSSASTDTGNVTITNSTFFQNGTSLSIADVDPTYTLSDNIFAGAGTALNLTSSAVAAKVTLNNNALVGAGSNAITADFAGGFTPAANNAPITSDPLFNATTFATLANVQSSFDVTEAAYFTASSTSGPLNGWGDGPASNVADWMMIAE